MIPWWLVLVRLFAQGWQWNDRRFAAPFEPCVSSVAQPPLPRADQPHHAAPAACPTGQLRALWRSSRVRRDGIVRIIDWETDPVDPNRRLCAVEAVTYIVEWTPADPDQALVHRYFPPERFVVAFADLSALGTSISDRA